VPLLLVPLALLAAVLVLVLLMPLSLIQRYRVGTARRAARGWIVTINLVTLVLSAGLFLFGAAISTIWVPQAFTSALTGLAAGAALGVLGLSLSRWEPTPRALHYTPNRWLVLGITLVVTARIAYGFWRSWEAWRSGLSGGSWIVAAGLPGSLAAGAVVIGYYVVYWAGVRRRLSLHRRTMELDDRRMPPSRGFARRIDR
jgi:hypothetical protein